MTPVAELRLLTARRLMRAGRHQDALRYFDADERVRGIATQYAAVLAKATSGWRSEGTRAQALFSAATMARTDGMDILGFELAPDFAVYDGMYDVGGGPDVQPPGEAARVAASKPAIDSRFHYRLIAVDHALDASNHLPPSSQAYAAVLCRATGWVIDREPERAAAVYARYVHNGPLVPWAAHFGHGCPEPDFSSAERRRWSERLAMVTWVYTQHPLRTLGVVALIVVAGIAVIVLRKRSRRGGADGASGAHTESPTS